MIGLFDPVLAAIFFFGLVAAVWVGATAGAPFRQRNDLREKVRALVSNETDWLNHEDAARYFRDQLEKHSDLTESAQLFDAGSKKAPTVDKLIENFSGWLKNGVDEGILEVRGIPVNGTEPIKVTKYKDHLLAHALGDQSYWILELENGTQVGDIQVRKATIREYVKWMRKP